MDNLTEQKDQNKALFDEKDLMKTFQLVNGLEILIRPLAYRDIPYWRPFIRNCSRDSLYLRFQVTSASIEDQGEFFLQTDFTDVITLGAEIQLEGGSEIIGVAWLFKDKGENVEVALLVADKWQHQGVATKLCELCRSILSKWHIKNAVGSTTINNSRIISLLRKNKVSVRKDFEDNTLQFELALI